MKKFLIKYYLLLCNAPLLFVKPPKILSFEETINEIVNKERGASRFESLLSELGLLHRLVENKTQISKELVSEKINYQEVNTKIEHLKKESLKTLISSL